MSPGFPLRQEDGYTDKPTNQLAMCGIAGIVARERGTLESQAILADMLETLVHRGPDGEGTYLDPEASVLLGHRRLSVIDLSEAGAQPMSSVCGRYVLVLNGEIYNFRRLLAQLRESGYSQPLRGHSDTEVLLAAISHWGLEPALRGSIGMFALALWDSELQQLSLARDRLGKKPLYYGFCGDDLVFASELKAFRKHPEFRASIEPQALTLYLRYGYVPSPYCIVSGIEKLEPGHLLSIQPDQPLSSPRPFWSAVDIVRPLSLSPNQAKQKLLELLVDAVELRLISDVPLGVLLSGGVDSTLITAISQRVRTQPVKTFTVGFESTAFNEAEAAAKLAAFLGTDHTEVTLNSTLAMELVQELPTLHDEPFADPSLLPTQLVSQVARREVTVVLGGDGGDELFLGYDRHTRGGRYWNLLSRLPPALRLTAAGALKLLSRGLSLNGALANQLHRASGILGATSLPQLHSFLAGGWSDPETVYPGTCATPRYQQRLQAQLSWHGAAEKLAFFDQQNYLSDNILSKVDRASMAVGLEARAPLLDHRLVEFACGLPVQYKLCGGQAKWLLKDLLYDLVPRELVDRPKQGFNVPLADWLRGPFREWAGDWLSPSQLRRSNLFDAAQVGTTWHQFLHSGRAWDWQLWMILVFENWWSEFRS